MKERKKIKYGTLSILLLLAVSLNIHFGDFCEGMGKGLLFVFLSLIFIICFIIIEIQDLTKLINREEKFDFIPLAFFLFFILSNGFLIIANQNKFWKEIRYEGVVDAYLGRSSIVLFENNSFEATNSYIENRCTFTGHYHFEKNLLILEDNNLETKTDSTFTSRYLLLSDSILQPINKKYIRINLKMK